MKPKQPTKSTLEEELKGMSDQDIDDLFNDVFREQEQERLARKRKPAKSKTGTNYSQIRVKSPKALSAQEFFETNDVIKEAVAALTEIFDSSSSLFGPTFDEEPKIKEVSSMAITRIEQVMAKRGIYSATTKQLQAQAIMHWKEWRPKEAAELEKAGLLQEEALKAAERTDKGIRELMQAGYQHHEAEEVMLPRYILLKPEPEVIKKMERRR